MFKQYIIYAVIAVVVALMGTSEAFSEELELGYRVQFESEPIATIGDITLTQQELDVHMRRIPKRDRSQFVSSRRRIGEAMEQLFLHRAGAQRALDAGILDDPAFAANLYDHLARELSERHRNAWIEERMLDDYSEQARELYLADGDRFMSPLRYSFSHILIRTSGRGESEAMRRILEVQDRLREGEAFEALIAQYNEDQAETDPPGFYEAVPPDQLDRNFARALQDLASPGDITEPVRSRFGWHLIRLEEEHERERLSWEDAADEAKELARQRHRERLQSRYFSELISFNDVEIEPGAIEAFQRRYGFDPDAFENEESPN